MPLPAQPCIPIILHARYWTKIPGEIRRQLAGRRRGRNSQAKEPESDKPLESRLNGADEAKPAEQANLSGKQTGARSHRRAPFRIPRAESVRRIVNMLCEGRSALLYPGCPCSEIANVHRAQARTRPSAVLACALCPARLPARGAFLCNQNQYGSSSGA